MAFRHLLPLVIVIIKYLDGPGQPKECGHEDKNQIFNMNGAFTIIIIVIIGKILILSDFLLVSIAAGPR